MFSSARPEIKQVRRPPYLLSNELVVVPRNRSFLEAPRFP